MKKHTVLIVVKTFRLTDIPMGALPYLTFQLPTHRLVTLCLRIILLFN